MNVSSLPSFPDLDYTTSQTNSQLSHKHQPFGNGLSVPAATATPATQFPNPGRKCSLGGVGSTEKKSELRVAEE